MSLYTERPCRVCGRPLETILNLGPLHPSGFVRPDEVPVPTVPHELCVCSRCRLVQLRHTVHPDVMFRQYWYQSGINEVMRDELADVVEGVRRHVELTAHDVVIDIGANDGTLLASYPKGPLRVAFEPATNLQTVLHQHAQVVVADYFPRGLDQLRGPFKGAVKAITAIACFYDLDDPIDFLAHVKDLLHPDGVFVVQFQDWQQMQDACAFDNVCTEHLFYPTLAAVERMAAMVGLRVCDAELRTINGGSYRLYLQHDHHPASWRVDTVRQFEATAEAWETFDQFAWRCQEVKRQLQHVVQLYLRRGMTIDVYGASTKGNTLLQWCGLTGGATIRQAWERSPAKFGLRTAGTDIPIVDEVSGRLDPPPVLLCLIWQFREAVLQREAHYLADGGTIVFPLPAVDIVRGGA